MNTTRKRGNGRGKWLSGVLILLCSIYAAVCAGVYAAQEHLVFRPATGAGRTPGDLGLAYHDLRLTTSDEVAIHAWDLPPPNAEHTRYVLFLHGNAGHLSHRLKTIATLHALGHGVLALDYRGYGLSDGQPSETGTYKDARAGWDYLVERGIPPDRIVIYGRSLGGAVATALAAQVAPGALVIESSFTRLLDMARYRYPWLPVRWLLRMQYDTAARIAHVRCPVLVAHSPDDQIVPFTMGRELADRAPNLAAFVSLKGSHDRAFRAAGTHYHRRLDTFIREAR